MSSPFRTGVSPASALVEGDTLPGHVLSGIGEPAAAPVVSRLFTMIGDPLAAISIDGRFKLLNPAWEAILGWTEAELRERPLQDFIHPDDLEQTLALIGTGRDHAARIVNYTNRLRHRDGSWRWLLWSARCDGEIWYASAKDVTDRMWLERQALHDPLTHLPNRLLLVDRAHQALTRLRRSSGPVALLFIDLDRFKAINDNLGHAVGDQLLILVSQRLIELLRDSDTVARLGGDEFVILAEDLEGDEEALAIAERVLHAFERPFGAGAAEVAITASVGISISRDLHSDTESLLREADVAMYRAKRAGGNSLEIFDDSLRREVRSHLDIEHRLRHALPRQELLLDYQPILRLDDRRAYFCEALLRWRPDDAETIAPATFIGLAERSDLITEIGEWVLETACAQAVSWRRSGWDMGVAINVSARGLTEVDLHAVLRRTLSRHGLPPEALSIEVNEHAIMRDPERSRASLAAVAGLGVKVALDNFGLGSSSLSLAASLPLSTIKLDRSLVDGCDQNPRKRAMIVAVLALAAHSGLKTVAVGIDDARQLALLRELGCPLGQGFLLRPPSPAQHLMSDPVR